jgi:hypothetical protein
MKSVLEQEIIASDEVCYTYNGDAVSTKVNNRIATIDANETVNVTGINSRTKTDKVNLVSSISEAINRIVSKSGGED